MKILAPLLYASVQRPSAWSFMGIRVKIERKDGHTLNEPNPDFERTKPRLWTNQTVNDNKISSEDT